MNKSKVPTAFSANCVWVRGGFLSYSYISCRKTPNLCCRKASWSTDALVLVGFDQQWTKTLLRCPMVAKYVYASEFSSWVWGACLSLELLLVHDLSLSKNVQDRITILMEECSFNCFFFFSPKFIKPNLLYCFCKVLFTSKSKGHVG